MARDGAGKKARVFFACEQLRDGVSLLAALSRAQELEVDELSGAPNDIFERAVAKSADLVILLFPEITAEHEKCVRRILRGTFSHILLLTDSNVSNEIASDVGHVTVRSVPNLENGIESVVAQAVTLSGISRRPVAAATGFVPTGTGDMTKPSIFTEGAVSTKIVAVGASTGGTEAIFKLLSGLKTNMPGIVVVQHMPPVFTEMFARRLDRELPFEVCEASDNSPIKQGSVHIAPGDRHLMIKKIGGGFYTVLGDSQKVGGHCPSVNMLFDSVAKVAGNAATGVILTGMGSDGATGILGIRDHGGFTIGQDESSSVVYGMPHRAFELGAIMRQAPLDEIAGILMAHLGTV